MMPCTPFQLWAQLDSNQRLPDYESNFFPFRCFPVLVNLCHVADYQISEFSTILGYLLITSIVVYPIVYPPKINIAKIKTLPYAVHTIGKSKNIYQ